MALFSSSDHFSDTQKSLQLLQSVFPSHIYVNETENVVLGVYQRRGGAQTLVRVSESEESVPICVSLKDANDCILDEGDCWSMSCLSESLEISAAKLTLKIVFRSVPQCQPLKFEFCVNNVTEDGDDVITPFITEPFRVCRYELEVARQPDPVYYKDDGGFRNNHLVCGVRVMDHETKKPVKGRRIPIQCRLETENGDRLDFMIKQRVKRPRPSKKGRKKSHSSAVGEPVKVKYLMIHPTTPEIQPSTGNVSFGVRINDVSQNHHNQQFVLVIEPDWLNCPAVSDVWGCRTRKILVKSKSPEKLAHQKILAKRRSQRKANSVESCSSVTPDESHNASNPPMSATSDKSSFLPPLVGEDTMMDVSHSSLKRQNSLDSVTHVSRRYQSNMISSKKRRLNHSRSTDTPIHEDPSDLNSVPSQRWFPAVRNAQCSDDSGEPSEEESRVLWMRQAFELLGWREWICVGFQCQYLDPSLQEHCLLHSEQRVKSETCTKTMGYKIVRCLLCGAEGPWTSSSKPSHKSNCSLKMLKDSFLPLKSECQSMSLWPESEDISITDPPSSSSSSSSDCKSGLANGMVLPPMDPWPSHLPPPMFTPDAHLQASVTASTLLADSLSRSMHGGVVSMSKPGIQMPPNMPPSLHFDGSVSNTHPNANVGAGSVENFAAAVAAAAAAASSSHLSGLPPTPIFSAGTEIPATMVSSVADASHQSGHSQTGYLGIPPMKRQATNSNVNGSGSCSSGGPSSTAQIGSLVPPIQPPPSLSFDASARVDSRFSGFRMPLLLSTVPTASKPVSMTPLNVADSSTVPKIEESLEDTKEADSTRTFQPNFTALASPMLPRQSPFGPTLLSPMGNGIPASPMNGFPTGLFPMFPTPFGMALASPTIAHNGSVIPFAHSLEGLGLSQPVSQQPNIPDSLLGNAGTDHTHDPAHNPGLDGVNEQLSVPALSRVSSFIEDRKSAGEECSTDSTADTSTLEHNAMMNRSSTGSSGGGIPALEDDGPTLSVVPPILPPALSHSSSNIPHGLALNPPKPNIDDGVAGDLIAAHPPPIVPHSSGVTGSR